MQSHDESFSKKHFRFLPNTQLQTLLEILDNVGYKVMSLAEIVP